MINLRFFLLPATLAAASALRADTAPAQDFQDGDRWCVLGDSITHSGSYHTWISIYYATRFPDQKLFVYNCGISGDTAAGALKRLDWDVLSKHPTVVTIMLGMNDVGRSLYDGSNPGPATEKAKRDKIQAYEDNEAELVDNIQKTGARVILITPSAFDETVDLPVPKLTGVDEALGECAKYVTQLAANTGAAVIDFHGPMDQLDQSLQEKDPKMTIVGKDRIHPQAPGHLFMAYTFLKAQGVPADVAHLTVDASKKLFQESTNGTGSNLKIIRGGVTFTWLERALPFPIDPAAAAAVGWAPIVPDLDQEILQVLGLNAGARYELSIDGNEIRAYTADELAHGVNLAAEPSTPQYQQAVVVSTTLQDRAKLVVDGLRSLAQAEHQTNPDAPHPTSVEEMAAPMAKRLAMLNATNGPAVNKNVLIHYAERKPNEAAVVALAEKMTAQAYTQAVPKPHTYKLVLIKE